QANDACKCHGWKNPNPPTAPRMDLQQPVTNLSEPCRSCGHALADHVSHLENVSEEEINRLLGMVVDVENLFMSVHKEEDTDTKQVYFYLFKLLRKCILQMSQPVVEGSLGSPPFEKPNIEQGVLNFVQYKFSHLPPKERQTMYELSKMFLLCLNYWKLETPSQFRQRSQNDDVATYKVNYTRWLCYCHVPQSCDSLPRYETTHVFGRSLLKSIFTVTRRQLLEKFRVEKDKLVPEKRTLILTHFPKFLSMLEEEIYGENSPIWEADFTVPAAEGAQMVSRPGIAGSSSPSSGAGPVSRFVPPERPAVPAHLPTPFLPQIIKKLIERKQAQIRKVYPGLTCFKEGVRQIPIESVPGIRETGWKPLGKEKGKELKDPDQLSSTLKNLLAQIKVRAGGDPPLRAHFMEPVKKSEAPDYYEIIRFPIDLKTMTERLKNRYYVTKKLFIADLQRIITNCREYNPPDSDYCKCANTLEKFFYFKLKEGGLIDK
ncbi:Histone acetyltransferase KAT2A, partial [Charadrius vociferus]